LILASEETFDDQYRVKVHTQTQALSIDRENKVVVARNTQTNEKQQFPYDSLILAQGGKPIVPPLPGVDKSHVFQLWTLDDMDRMDRYITEKEPKKAVVVGGGFIGLEMVEALTKRGVAVTLVEMAGQVMATLEGEFAGMLTKELQDYGVKLKLGKSLQSVEDTCVRLSDGTAVDTDFVLLSVGVKPTLQLAKDANLAMGSCGGLMVDEHLRTSDPSIYCSWRHGGDPSDGIRQIGAVALAGPANRQGRIAAENALGGNRVYKGALGTSIVIVFEVAAGSTGLSLKAAREAGFDADAVVVHKASHTAYYPGSEKVSLMLIWDKSTGKVLGAQVGGRVGVDKRIDVLATAIAGGLTIDDLAELDLAYAPRSTRQRAGEHGRFHRRQQTNRLQPTILARNLSSLYSNSLRLPSTSAIPSVCKANFAVRTTSAKCLRGILTAYPRACHVLITMTAKKDMSSSDAQGSGFDKVYISAAGISAWSGKPGRGVLST
jgi:NADPH-dependent 2,4-dienoyl-CoA reductase/sulfur reductase-like enzyme